MSREWSRTAIVIAWLVTCCGPALAQTEPPTILTVEVENFVNYVTDTVELSALATNRSATSVGATRPRNFGWQMIIADIVAVNGRPAKGTMLIRSQQVRLTPTPTPGEAVADTVRGAIMDQTFEILRADGVPIGTIMARGLAAGAAPPGSPSLQVQGNNAVVGGTGAFLGVRGQVGGLSFPNVAPARLASITEDPANRRANGGGRSRFLIHLIPFARPEIIATTGGPAVTHSADFSLVSAARPARPGEILSVFAVGLGPTRPGVDAGLAFPATPLQEVIAPVEVMVDGRSAEVLATVGLPGTVGGYQVNFRLPADIVRGTATVQLSAAWVAGTAVSIPVQ